MPKQSSTPIRADFLVVANRLPVDRKTGPDGEPVWRTSPGGLVTALEPVMKRKGGAWIGWHGAPDETIDGFEHEGYRIVPVPLSTQDVEEFYEGFSNATLCCSNGSSSGGVPNIKGVVSNISASGAGGHTKRRRH